MKMKRTFKFLTLTVLLSMAGALSAFAIELVGSTAFQPNPSDFSFEIASIDMEDNTGEVIVIGTAMDLTAETELTIPETVSYSVNGSVGGVTYNSLTTFTVIGVRGEMFHGLNALETINIPLTIQFIGSDVFNNCAKLKNFNVGDPSKTAAEETSDLEYLGDYVFGDTGLKKIDLSKCTKLNLTATSSEPRIGNRGVMPFISRESNENNVLEELIIPENVKIGQAVAGLTALTKLNQDADGNNVVKGNLAENALAGTGLTSVVLKGEKTEPTIFTLKIGPNAFNKSKIQTLTIDADIATNNAVAPDAFAGMEDLTTVNLNGTLRVAGAMPGGVFVPGETPDDEGTYTNAFPDSKLTTLNVKGIAAANAISPYAFANQPTLKTVNFNGDIVAGGIGRYAFDGIGNAENSCATITFNGALKGKEAIGKYAFKGAAIKFLYFNAAIAKEAIGDYAFYQISKGIDACPAQVRFQTGAVLGEKAIGQYAFSEAYLHHVYFAEPISSYAAVRGYAFQEATIIGGTKIAIQFDGEISGEKAIAAHAFKKADIQNKILFKGDISGLNAINTGAFAGFKNSKSAEGTEVRFECNITGEEAITKDAFKLAAVRNVAIVGNVSGKNAIGESAFADCRNIVETPDGEEEVATLIRVSITGEITNESEEAYTYAICPDAFAGNGKLAEINLAIWKNTENNIWAKPSQEVLLDAPAICAIAATAFEGAGADIENDEDGTFNGAVLNIGRIKTAAAIQAGAFAGAKLKEVNFNELMATYAIAAKQFAEGEVTLPGTDGSGSPREVEAATINTVNFNKELKAWESANNQAELFFIGQNAFTGTEVATVNFNAPISSPGAIGVMPFGMEPLTAGPFADNGAEMTVNFNKGVVAHALLQGAFAYSNTVEINLDNDSKYEELAFDWGSFMNIALEFDDYGDVVTPTEINVNVNYTDPTVKVYRAFSQEAFYEEPEFVDILFNTTEKVQKKYTTASNFRDLTPYRMKIVATKYIHLTEYNGKFWGVFDPQDEQYIIEKFQQDATVGIYAGYVDDGTVKLAMDPNSPLDADGNPTEPLKFGNGRPAYNAKMYMNGLRIQYGGQYVINAGHTLIVVADKDIEVKATQDLEGKWGSVQTFAALTPWQCNDLRYNPATINPILNPYNNQIVNDIPYWEEEYQDHKWASSHVWPGFVNQNAVKNGERDYYGNIMRDYAMFKQDPGSFEFERAQSLGEGQVYILAAPVGGQPAYTTFPAGQETNWPAQTQEELRRKYSSKALYPVNPGSLGTDTENFLKWLSDGAEGAFEAGAEEQLEADAEVLEDVADFDTFVDTPEVAAKIYQFLSDDFDAFFLYDTSSDFADVLAQYNDDLVTFFSSVDYNGIMSYFLPYWLDIYGYADLLKAIQNANQPQPGRLTIVWNDEDEVTGIMENVVRGDAATIKSNAVYNLNGMRVDKAQKGVFIQNGKKIIR